jgi:hypothetical protein
MKDLISIMNHVDSVIDDQKLDPTPEPPLIMTKLISITYVIISLVFVFLCFSCYSAHKTYKLVKFSDLPLLCSILCITMALLLFIIDNILQLKRSYELEEPGWNLRYWGGDDANMMILSIDQVKVMLTFNAFMFDLYKWSIMILATSKKIKTNTDEENDK